MQDYLGAEIISHFVMHGSSVADIVKHLITHIKKEDEDLSHIFLEALKKVRFINIVHRKWIRLNSSLLLVHIYLFLVCGLGCFFFFCVGVGGYKINMVVKCLFSNVLFSLFGT